MLFTGPLEHRHLVHLLALADACVVPSIFPEAFGMVAAEAAAAGCPPLVARHSGLAEVAEGLEAEYPPELRHLARSRPGDAADLREKLRDAARARARRARGDHSGRPARGRRALELGERRRAAARSGYLGNASTTVVADGRRAAALSGRDDRAAPRAQFEEATDFTVAVEEEFAILDPESLDLANRFEDVQAAARDTALEEHLVGELIASEVEIRTGRQESFADVPAAMVERRAQLRGLVEPMDILLGATGTHPWADWKKQRIIDTPHYRRNDELLRYVVWRNNTFGLHVHVAINGPDRAIAVVAAMRNFLPELLALSASSPFVENVNTGLHSARTQIFTRFFPRCGVPDAFASWDEYERFVRFLYDTGSITEHTQMWWSVRTHLAFPTVEIRICDGQPELAEAQALAAFAASLAARVARALRRGRARRAAAAPADRGELLARDPLRAPRRAASTSSAASRSRRGSGWRSSSTGCSPSPRRSAPRRTSRSPSRTQPSGRSSGFEEGASLEEIYAEQVQATEKIGG